MKKIIILISFVFIGLVALKIFTMPPQGWKANLVNPMGSKNQNSDVTSTPVASPNIPKTFNFDSSTDLKKELDNINPQVLDSDFE